MSEPENPLSRWARLKQAAKAQEEVEAASLWLRRDGRARSAI